MPLKFKPRPITAEIPFKDGAVIIIKRPIGPAAALLRQQARALGIVDAIEVGHYVLEHSITGWRGIVDQNDKQLKVTDDTRAQIYEDLFDCPESIEALLIYQKGELGNLQAGTNGISIGDGTRPSATDASEKTTN